MLIAEGQALGQYRVLVQVEDGLTGDTLVRHANFTLERWALPTRELDTGGALR
ncbi:MAG TPA: hypothetical protein VLK65_15825 [Vicinamibacteria bacterium]|nr:hypothetical protein [Vicinamibacteria bacterium]